MVDIETLGTSYNSVIVQIGAVYFDRYTGLLDGDTKTQFSVNIQIQDCLNKGLKIDAGALKFWFEQGADKMSWLKEPVSLEKALAYFRDFSCKAENVWSHASFDMPIIANAYQSIGQRLPFPYKAIRDIRTLVSLADIPFDKDAHKIGKTHTGLEDAIYQVSYCVKCFNKLKEITNEKT